MKNLTKKQKKQILVGSAVVGMVLLIARLVRAKTPPDGKVIIGPVTVTTDKYTEADKEGLRLTALYKKAGDILGLDPDTMSATNHPSVVDSLVVESIITELARGGRQSDASFLATLLKEAKTLPSEQA